MKNLDDLSNSNNLDESVSGEYSNAGGFFGDIQKGLSDAGKSISGALSDAEKKARELAQKAREEAERAAKKIKEEAERQKKQLQELKNKVDNKAKQIRDKAKDKAKKLANKAKDDAKKLRKQIEDTQKKIGKNLKKVGKKLRDMAKGLRDKFKNAFRKVLRNLILKSIRKNVHGLATRMFTAIATPDEIKLRKFKPAFVNKAKGLYSKVLSDWKKLGGTEEEFNEAVRQGGSKKFLKNPYKNINGNNPDEFYSYLVCEDSYYGADGDTDEDNELLQAQAEQEKAEEETAVVINEEEATLDVPDEQEKQKGLKAFIAKILALFKKNKADENPYEDGTEEATDFANQDSQDLGNRPEESDSDNQILKDLEGGEEDEKTEKDSKKESTGDDKILGMPKKVAIGVGIALLAVGGFVAYKYFKGKK